jgi:hypothetical protein
MSEQIPIEIVQTVTVQKPMTGAAMLQRLEELKKEKEATKKQEEKK